MSTAVMPQSAMYDFGEIMFKNISAGQHGESGGGVGNHLAVGAPPLSPRKVRYALSRMSSSPTATANLVTSLLDNLSLHQAQQQHHRRLERTQSAPAPAAPGTAQAQSAAASAAAAAAAAVNTSRYKTELCRPYEEFGVCKYGDKCQFAHGIAELRSLARHPKYKTELCRTYHTVGFCPYGPRCHFVHNEEEARQHNRAVAAMLAASGQGKRGSVRPAALSPALSLDSPSPSSSLSQSPTSSVSSFFVLPECSSGSEPELHSPGVHSRGGDSPTGAASPTVLTVSSHHQQHHTNQQQHNHHKQQQCPASPGPESPDFRLPVFNRLSASVLALGDLML